MKCWKCGEVLKDKAIFCPKCGTKVLTREGLEKNMYTVRENTMSQEDTVPGSIRKVVLDDEMPNQINSKDLKPEAILRSIMTKLSNQQRVCIVSYYMEGKNYNEIAEELETTPDVVKRHIEEGFDCVTGEVNEYKKRGLDLQGMIPVTFFVTLMGTMPALTMAIRKASISGIKHGKIVSVQDIKTGGDISNLNQTQTVNTGNVNHAVNTSNANQAVSASNANISNNTINKASRNNGPVSSTNNTTINSGGMENVAINNTAVSQAVSTVAKAGVGNLVKGTFLKVALVVAGITAVGTGTYKLMNTIESHNVNKIEITEDATIKPDNLKENTDADNTGSSNKSEKNNESGNTTNEDSQFVLSIDNSVYEPVLESYYQMLYECEDNNGYFPENSFWVSTISDVGNFKYCFYDVNSDGIDEMFIRLESKDKIGQEWKKDIFDIWTVYNGEPTYIDLEQDVMGSLYWIEIVNDGTVVKSYNYCNGSGTYFFELEGNKLIQSQKTFEQFCTDYVEDVTDEEEAEYNAGMERVETADKNAIILSDLQWNSLVKESNIKSAYREKLISLDGKFSTKEAEIGMCYINDDDIPELILRENSCHAASVYVLTYSEENGVTVFNTGSYGVFKYSPKQNIIRSYDSGMGAFYTYFQKITDGELITTCSLYAYDDTIAYMESGDEANNCWEINDKRVSEEEYKEKKDELDTKYTLEETEFSYMYNEKGSITKLFSQYDF